MAKHRIIDYTTMLKNFRYYLGSDDLYISLNGEELDALCAYFASCQADEDFDESTVITMATNQIEKRLRNDKKASAAFRAENPTVSKISKEDSLYFKSIRKKRG